MTIKGRLPRPAAETCPKSGGVRFRSLAGVRLCPDIVSPQLK